MTKSEKTLAHHAVLRSLERSPQTFKQLLESCHSLFPDQLVSLLDEMEKNRLIRRDGEEYDLDSSVPNRWRKIHADWNENLDKAYTSLSAIMGRIHLPHCLDYEWWFTHGGREKVAELLLQSNPLPAPATVVFLGSPLFGAFASALLPESQIYILDKSEATLNTIRDDVDSARVRRCRGYGILRPAVVCGLLRSFLAAEHATCLRSLRHCCLRPLSAPYPPNVTPRA